MNAVREINRINQRELELGTAGKGSWHDEYKDSAYIFVGGLPFDLTEGDVITIFSQWGEVMDLNMPRDKETGKQRGFGFLMYEDQRSTVMAVDNMNGTQVLGRTIRVDHCRKYNQPGTKNEDGEHVAPEEPTYNAMPPILEGSESESSGSEPADDLEEEDPMAAFIRSEKRKSKAKAITDGKKRKHDGETKAERKARRDAKKARKAGRESKKTVKVEPEIERRRERDDRDRRRGSPERVNGRANREDWRQGRWELERDERKRDEPDRSRDDSNGRGSRDRRELGNQHSDRSPAERTERRREMPPGAEVPRPRERSPRRDRDREDRGDKLGRDGRDDRDRRRHDDRVRNGRHDDYGDRQHNGHGDRYR